MDIDTLLDEAPTTTVYNEFRTTCTECAAGLLYLEHWSMLCSSHSPLARAKVEPYYLPELTKRLTWLEGQLRDIEVALPLARRISDGGIWMVENPGDKNRLIGERLVEKITGDMPASFRGWSEAGLLEVQNQREKTAAFIRQRINLCRAYLGQMEADRPKNIQITRW